MSYITFDKVWCASRLSLRSIATLHLHVPFNWYYLDIITYFLLHSWFITL